MRIASFSVLVVLATVVTAANTVYFIRHGEKPADGGNGLNAQGVQRSQCLRTVFGASSPYNIGKIMAQTPKSNGKRTRPLMTVQPVATDLGLSVDISCDRDDPECVAKAVKAFDATGSTKNILICWEHDNLSNLAEALGMKRPPTYPDESFNLIWTDPVPYTNIIFVTSENCPGLD
ncbi:putative phosphoglycerate mutase family protein [Amylocarpus encephaloides]|uniref:Phosphoglycerate mutase family protein n=1 Tax=Amylocarpus encephaloides TaxID=45428 RepID=A0A9P7YJB6_9HELO|nr:putative phosphoglycerate mutase family protein [Amylocarpus encephaloides]